MSCKICKFAIWHRTEKGNIRSNIAGKCMYDIKIPILPSSAENHYSLRDSRMLKIPKVSIWLDSGLDCKVFEAHYVEEVD